MKQNLTNFIQENIFEYAVVKWWPLCSYTSVLMSGTKTCHQIIVLPKILDDSSYSWRDFVNTWTSINKIFTVSGYHWVRTMSLTGDIIQINWRDVVGPSNNTKVNILKSEHVLKWPCVISIFWPRPCPKHATKVSNISQEYRPMHI